MEAKVSKSLRKPIISLKVFDNGRLAVVDSDTTVRYFNKNSFELLGGFKINLTHSYYKTEVFTFDETGEYFATLGANARESHLYSTQSKKIVAKLDRHHGEVSCVGIDPLSRYMFSCGDDGKTFAVDMVSGKLVFTLPIHVDTINAIACSKNANWVATASYDKKVSLFNLVTMSPKAQLRAHYAAVTHIAFFHQNKLVSIDKDAKAIVWDAMSAKVIERLDGVHDEVTKITLSGDEQFLFVGTKLGYVLVYDLYTYKLLSPKYIKLKSSITAMAFDTKKNALILGCEDGELYLFDIYEGLKDIKAFLLQKEFDLIENAIAENPLLAYTKVYETLDTFWQKSLQRAKAALESGDAKKAQMQLEPFRKIPAKNRVIKELLAEYSEFDKFKLFIQQGKYPLAYSLANKHPLYRESKLFKLLENNWKKCFREAQRWMLQPRGTDKVQEILAPYRGVSEKTKLIQDLRNEGEVYKRFRTSISQKEFKIAFELLKQHPFLHEFAEYDVLMNYADTLYIESQELIEEGDTQNALKVLRVLSDFADFSDEVNLLTNEIMMRQKFFKAVEEEDISTAYNLLAQSEELQETKDGQKLLDAWNDTVAIANKSAVKGDAISLKRALREYMKISSKYMSIATLFAWCYMAQLESALENKEAQRTVENGIKNYLLSFGLLEQIESFHIDFKAVYPQSKLSLEHLPKGSLKMWRPSMIVESILE